jgi:hypothetical protein
MRPAALAILLLLYHGAGAQVSRADGYKGIWFTLGQFSQYGDKYSGGLGTYTSSHVPVAIYSKNAGKTFFVYGGTRSAAEKHLLIMISYYDHKTNRVPRPVIVYDKKGVDDPHDNASLNIDAKGYIWVFVSGRNTSRPGIVLRSREPYAIDEFDTIVQEEITYPQPWFLPDSGFILLFTKYTRGRELYWTTATDQPHKKLAGMGGHYQVSNVWKNKVVTVFNYHPGGNVDKRTNCYLLQTTDAGKTWTTITGKPVNTPVSEKTHESLVKDFEVENKLVYLNDLNFDKDGNPVILAVVSKHFQPGPAGNPREWVLMHWKNERWNFTTVCTSTHNYDMGSLYIEKDLWQIIGPTEKGPQEYGTGGEMALWTSKDAGKTWVKTKMLTFNSLRNHSYARRPLNAHADFYALWADGDADKFSGSHLYYCNRKGEVMMLPYTMKNEFEKPVQLPKRIR